MSVYAGIGVHRRRSPVAVINEGGGVLADRNVPDGVKPVLSVIGGLPAGTPAAYEAAFGWGWLLELLEDYGVEPHMVHPLQCKAIASARLKNGKAGAATLAQLLRADLLPEAQLAPPQVRQLRAMLRHRAHPGPRGPGRLRLRPARGLPERAWLAGPDLPAVSREVIDGALALMDASRQPVSRLDAEVRQRANAGPRVKVLTRLPGAGPFTALVLPAEIGGITRFSPARKLASRAGLTPTVRGSGRTVRHGHISKPGPARAPRVPCEAAQTARRHPDFAAGHEALARRRGKTIAATAIARKLITRACHLLTGAAGEPR